MIYTFARVGAVLQVNVGDYFSQGSRGWVRLHEKGGKKHEAPCVPKLEAYLDAYIAAAGTPLRAQQIFMTGVMMKRRSTSTRK